MDHRAAHRHAGELDQMERNAQKLVENAKVKAWKSFTLPFFKERDEAAALIQAVEADRFTQLNWPPCARIGEQTDALPPGYFNGRSPHPAPPATNPARPGAVGRSGGRPGRLNQQRVGSHLYAKTSSPRARAAVPPCTTKTTRPTQRFPDSQPRFRRHAGPRSARGGFWRRRGQTGRRQPVVCRTAGQIWPAARVDTGIREVTIFGQAIGMAMRGLRPIAEIQYLDYIALRPANHVRRPGDGGQWRTAGGQKAPVIVRTRGHRLEGVWHSGSPMGAVVHLLRGMHVLVPRNMVQAAGFYNTLLQADEPGLIVEVLSGYRLKERLPANLSEITLPVGVPEVLRAGDDVTLVTYGAGCRLALDRRRHAGRGGHFVEVIDVQSLLPFDVNGRMLESLQKTSRIVFMDEDVPGGATAYMMQQVIEEQGGYHWLDSNRAPSPPNRTARLRHRRQLLLQTQRARRIRPRLRR
jgi:2-oxoisovalerate dehydrogenase E1 component